MKLMPQPALARRTARFAAAMTVLAIKGPLSDDVRDANLSHCRGGCDSYAKDDNGEFCNSCGCSHWKLADLKKKAANPRAHKLCSKRLWTTSVNGSTGKAANYGSGN